MKNQLKLLALTGLFGFALISNSCQQSEPPEDVRIGDEITFSGYTWDIKASEAPIGPGPNPFSKRADDLYVDSQGRLHLKIVEHNGIWYSAEVVSQEVTGYGTYTWTVTGDLKNMARNVVLGLFSWDNNTFQTDGNSEVDIEFSYWGDSTLSSSLLYSVQPVNFSVFFPERTCHPDLDGDLFIGTTTHTFTWTTDLITWRSYKGFAGEGGEEIASWSFDNTNPPRIKEEGGNSSDGIRIPAPGATTNARMNFWIASYLDTAPYDREQHEIIIESFDYQPL